MKIVRQWWPLLFILIGLLLLGGYWLGQSGGAAQPAGPVPTATPTVIPTPDWPIPAPERIGASGGQNTAAKALDDGLAFAHFFDWHVSQSDLPQQGVQYWQMVRLREEGLFEVTWEEIEAATAAHPGAVWVVGNEPDVLVQDNVTAEQYARFYHDVYTFIKERDPHARLAVAGVGQSTPLRLAYLDRILNSYQAQFGEPMPVDVWTVHGFILREEADSWGVGIPPGMESDLARLYEIEDHDDLAIFKQNLIDFRTWMAARGYRDTPLALTEMGILMPNDYGFPPEAVADFMVETFDWMATAVNETGYPPDENRLVQWWFWYSIYDEWISPTGNLYDHRAEEITPLGQTFTNYQNP